MPQVKTRPEHVLDPVAVSLCQVYANALLQTTPEDTAAEDVYDELRALLELLDGEPGFFSLLTAALLTVRQRRELVERVFAERVSERVYGLLRVLARNGRLELLGGIADSFRAQLNRREGKREMTIRTPVALDDAQVARLSRMLEETFGAEPVLRVEIDPTLLGGAVVQVGDERFDASVAGKLDRLRERLKEVKGRISLE